MSTPRRCLLALLVLFLSLITIPANASSTPAGTAQVSPPASPASSQTYDQIVRLSLVEGDVRISRGKEGERATGSEWGQAVVNLPIASGFSLVTGTGRAEIELEDASTIYLSDNSVLTFNQLSTTGGVPDTELTLVSGTATLHVHPTFPGESFVMNTPTARLAVKYGGKAFMRISSYLDAVSITPQVGSTIMADGITAKPTVPGQTVTYDADRKLVSEPPSDTNAFTAWDEWTAKRVAIRAASMAAVMKDAGLTSPVPGLAEMNGQGIFFDCAPFGTCWEPTGGWGHHEAETRQPVSQQQSYSSPHPSVTSAHLLLASQTLQPTSPGATQQTAYDDLFPCMPGQVRRLMWRDPVTGQQTVLQPGYLGGAPYNWAVCHTGTWIHRGHRYSWVAGTHRHHQCPVHWVNYGHSKAYVPIHPHDVAGKSPINMKYGIFVTSGKNGEFVERVAFAPETQVKVLNTAPKEFRAQSYPPLQRAETPRIEAHLVKDGVGPANKTSAKSSGTAITFDHKSQSFLVARQETVGGRSTMVTQHFGGREGNGQMSGGSRSSGGSNSAGASRSSSSGGSSGGGGSHASSGGGGSAGGGSHR
jgi:FecR protein